MVFHVDLYLTPASTQLFIGHGAEIHFLLASISLVPIEEGISRQVVRLQISYGPQLALQGTGNVRDYQEESLPITYSVERQL